MKFQNEQMIFQNVGKKAYLISFKFEATIENESHVWIPNCFYQYKLGKSFF